MRIALAVLGAGLGLLALMLGNVPSTAEEPQQQWGTIKGQVVWGEKDLPTPEKLDITKDKEACLKDGAILSEKYIVDPKTKGVKNAFVFLVAGTPPKKGQPWAKIPIHPSLAKSKEKTVTIDQPCCSFVPHALVMRDDQTLEIKNSASVAHNTHLIGANDYAFNKILTPGSSLTEKVPANAGKVNVQCDIHPWMKATIWMFDHPYFQLTGTDGKFEMKNVPAGDYRIIIYQEGMGWVALDTDPDLGKFGKPIKIKADGETDLGTFKVMMSKD